MNVEDDLKVLKWAVGQKLLAIQAKDDSVKLIFEKDYIEIRFPTFDCRCLDCNEEER